MYTYKWFTIERQWDSIIATNGSYVIAVPVWLIDTRKGILKVMTQKINFYLRNR